MSSTTPHRFQKAVPLLIVSVGALLAFVIWTLPNLSTFQQERSQIPLLWQVPANRFGLIALVVKTFSPVIIGLMLWAAVWLYRTLHAMAAETETAVPPASAIPMRQTPMPTQQAMPSPLYPPAPTMRTMPPGFAPEPPLSPTISDMPTAILGGQPANVPPSQETRISTPTQPAVPPERRQKRKPTTRPEPASGQSRADKLREQRLRRLHKPAGATGESAEQQQASPTPPVPDVSEPPEEQSVVEEEGTPTEPGQAPVSSTSPSSEVSNTAEPYVLVRLLKQVRISLHVPGGIDRVVPFTLNAKRVQLLAYLGWKRTDKVNRDRMLEDIFGHGQDDEQADPAKLSEKFDSHRKLLRRDLRQAIANLNEEMGREVIPPNLDIFQVSQRLWALNTEVCRVPDIEAIEAEHTYIEQGKKEGRIGQSVPEDIHEACERLVAAYPGDFLEDLLENYPDDFDPWMSSWARQPFTECRDMFLQALWYAAEYELQAGQRVEDELSTASNGSSPKERRQRQHAHYERAAQLYHQYATTATASRFDLKLTFAKASNRPHGERVVMSERAIRRAKMLYGSLQNTALVDQVYSEYYKRMRKRAGDWQPSQATMTELANAKSRTNAFRLPAQQMLPHEAVLPDTDGKGSS